MILSSNLIIAFCLHLVFLISCYSHFKVIYSETHSSRGLQLHSQNIKYDLVTLTHPKELVIIPNMLINCMYLSLPCLFIEEFSPTSGTVTVYMQSNSWYHQDACKWQRKMMEHRSHHELRRGKISAPLAYQMLNNSSKFNDLLIVHSFRI